MLRSLWGKCLAMNRLKRMTWEDSVTITRFNSVGDRDLLRLPLGIPKKTIGDIVNYNTTSP